MDFDQIMMNLFKKKLKKLNFLANQGACCKTAKVVKFNNSAFLLWSLYITIKRFAYGKQKNKMHYRQMNPY
jgi:hypothetical protein